MLAAKYASYFYMPISTQYGPGFQKEEGHPKNGPNARNYQA